MSLRWWRNWLRSLPVCHARPPNYQSQWDWSPISWAQDKWNKGNTPTSEPSFHSHRHNFSLQPCCQMKFDTCDSTVNPVWDLNRREMIIFLFLFLFPASISSLPLPISLPLLSLAPGTEKAWPLRFPPSLRLVLNTQQIKAQARKLTLAIYFKPPHPSR